MIINDTFVNVNEYNNNIKLDTTIIITHGLGEYSKSYTETALKLESLGYNVITYDLRGHGKTRGKKGYVNSYNEFLGDLDYLVNYSYTKTKKVFLIGHSMGGLITNLYTSLNNNVDGVIITASPTSYIKDLKIFRYIPKFLINNIKLKTNFDDPKLVHENTYVKDAYDIDYFYLKLPIETLIKGMKVLRKNYHNFETPVLLIYSKSDRLASPTYGTHFINKIMSEDKKLLIYDNSYHNIFNDIEKDKLIKDIDEWIKERI